uniref:Tetraspanin n=2 Tax=Macrostomum lignano TaxID=282301 RepID=A0A1I8GM81_9PLAT
ETNLFWGFLGKLSAQSMRAASPNVMLVNGSQTMDRLVNLPDGRRGGGDGADGGGGIDAEGSSDGCYSVLKSIMFFFNGIFWLLGVATFSVGIAIHTDREFRVAVAGYVPGAGTGASIFIVVGVAMVTTGFLGCCGAIRESQCMLLSFFVILSAVFTMLIGAGIWAAASKDQLSALLSGELERRVATYNTDLASRDIMDTVQDLFECCGAQHGGSDYQRRGLEVPSSCARRFRSKDGCYHRISDSLAANLARVTGTGVSIAFVVLLGMVLSMMIFCNLRDLQSRQHGPHGVRRRQP